MLQNHACFFIPLRRGAQQAVLCQQICASGALLNNNPIRTTRQRRAHGDRRSSLPTRFEDALLTHTNAFSPSQSVPEARHFNISKEDRRISETRLLFLSIYVSVPTTLPQPVCKASPMRRQRPYTPPCRQQCSSPQEGRDFPCMPVSSPCRQVSAHKELWRW